MKQVDSFIHIRLKKCFVHIYNNFAYFIPVIVSDIAIFLKLIMQKKTVLLKAHYQKLF